jgi:hypothetical protein
MGKRQRRMGKVEREKRRAVHASTWAEGFEHGYLMGYEQGAKDTAEQVNRNVLKWAHRGQ